MSDEKIDVDDYVRWLGKQKPIGLAWIGLFVLELAAAIFICVYSYVFYINNVPDESVTNKQILEIISERYKKE